MNRTYQRKCRVTISQHATSARTKSGGPIETELQLSGRSGRLFAPPDPVTASSTSLLEGDAGAAPESRLPEPISFPG